MALSRIEEPHAIMPWRKLTRIALLGLAFLTTPIISRADTGIPLIAVSYPIMLDLLIGVIAIETLWITLTLHTPWGKTLAGTSIVNVLTTLLGYPLVWFMYLLLSMAVTSGTLHLDQVPWHSVAKISNNLTGYVDGIFSLPAWLGGWGPDLRWPAVAGFALLLIPCFFVSGKVEALFLSRKWWFPEDVRRTKSAVWRANVASYLFLLIVGSLMIYLRAQSN